MEEAFLFFNTSSRRRYSNCVKQYLYGCFTILIYFLGVIMKPGLYTSTSTYTLHTLTSFCLPTSNFTTLTDYTSNVMSKTVHSTHVRCVERQGCNMKLKDKLTHNPPEFVRTYISNLYLFLSRYLASARGGI